MALGWPPSRSCSAMSRTAFSSNPDACPPPPCSRSGQRSHSITLIRNRTRHHNSTSQSYCRTQRIVEQTQKDTPLRSPLGPLRVRPRWKQGQRPLRMRLRRVRSPPRPRRKQGQRPSSLLFLAPYCLHCGVALRLAQPVWVMARRSRRLCPRPCQHLSTSTAGGFLRRARRRASRGPLLKALAGGARPSGFGGDARPQVAAPWRSGR